MALNYAYTEASAPNFPDVVSILTGPCFNLNAVSYANFQFNYHMRGYEGDEPGILRLEVSTNAGSSWTSVWSKSGDQDNLWHLAEVDLTAYVGQTIQLRFYSKTGDTSIGDIAIDNLNFSTQVSSTPLSCNATISSFPYQESFESSLGDWEILASSNNIWTRKSGGTTSGGTGPSSANDGIYYMYTEASFPNYPNIPATLQSPCFDLSNENAAFLSFDYHMYGAAMGSIALQVSTDQGINWVDLWAESGNIGNSWNSTNIDLSTYVGQSVRLRFYAVTGTLYTGDLAIDNIELTNSPPSGSTGCVAVVNTFPYQESFESGQGLWVEKTEVLDMWRRNSGGTSSGSTGPSTAFDGLYYMYTEASTPNYPTKTALLEGPCFDLSQAAIANLQFQYHMYGTGMGSLALEVSTNNGSGWSTLWSKSGNQGNNWLNATVNLNQYLGQSIRLRFKTVTGSSFRSDAAIDALILSAPTTANGTLVGNITFPSTYTCPNTAYRSCCDPNPPGGAVANVSVSIEDINTSTVYNASTNASGDFSNTIPATDVKITALQPSTDWGNGLSTFDKIILSQHINGTKIIDCPLTRIASDINNDGQLNQTDLDLINDLVLGFITSVPGAPNWKFIPKRYADDSDLHPDDRFVGDFWNKAKTDQNGNEYPFLGELREASEAYDYSSSNTWLGTINPGGFDPTTSCPGGDWGFYTVKAGDVNGSASYFFSGGGGSRPAISRNSLQATPIRNNNLVATRSGNKKYTVELVAASKERIIAYEMNVNFDDEMITLGKIKPNQEDLKQVEAKNFGQALKTVRGGSFNTTWLEDLKENARGKDMSTGLTLFSFEFMSKASIETVRNAIQLDDALIKTTFYGVDGPVKDVDLQIIIEPTKKEGK